MKIKFMFGHTITAMGVLVFAGCSTNIRVNEIDKVAAPNTIVNGIPFRMKERYRISLYKLDGAKYQSIETSENYATLPNLEHVYILKLNSSALADGTLTFKLNPDNTLLKVKVESTSKLPEFITAAGKAKKSIADAESAKSKSEATNKAAEETDVIAKEDGRLAAFDAEQTAALASVELDALPPTASALDRTKAEQKLSRARVLANQKARRAGLALPFPDVGT